MNKISTILLTLMTFSSFAVRPKCYNRITVIIPHDVLFQITGLDIKYGRVYCATRYGDDWILEKKKWSKSATGLHEPCGLVVDKYDALIVTQMPEMTKLVDSDNDCIADPYLNLTDEWEFHNNYHEYNFGGVIEMKVITGKY